MIGRLVGHVVEEEPTGGLLLDVGGVGYELACPVGTVARAQSSASGSQSQSPGVILYVHTNLRQEALELFGFCALEERAAFRKLIQVPNVGPRLALAVLNVLPASELAEVVDAEDKTRLSKVPGVGKKTAERLVLELRGKLPRGSRKVTGGSGGGADVPDDLDSRLITALTGLGYRGSEAEKAAQHLLPEGAARPLSELLREALTYLAGSKGA